MFILNVSRKYYETTSFEVNGAYSMKLRVVVVVLALYITFSSVLIEQGFLANLGSARVQSMGVVGTVGGGMLWLHTEGRNIKDENGSTVQLKGVNTPHGCDSTTFVEGSHMLDENDFATMKSWGMNVVRFTFNTGWFLRNEYNPSIDEWVNRAERQNLYIILDMHRWDGDVGFFPNDVNAWINVWRDIANRYKNRPQVLFELFNEPHDGAVGDGSSADGFTNWRNFTQQCLNAIRATGAQNIVVVGGWVWQNELTSWGQGDRWLRDADGSYADNVVYSTHHYVTGWGHNPPSNRTDLLNFFRSPGVGWDLPLVNDIAPLLVGEYNLQQGGSPTDPNVPYDGDERLTCFDNYMNIFDDGDLGAYVSYTPWAWVMYESWAWNHEFLLVPPYPSPAKTGQILQNHLSAP